jgi:acyl-CoA synthetase (AMP-forming)/AMP-acid ligase II
MASVITSRGPVRLSRREDGAILLSSPQPLQACPQCVGVDLEYWADHDAPQRYGAALAAIEGLHQAQLMVSDDGDVPAGAQPFSSLLAHEDEAAVSTRHALVGPDAVAKILFTSGAIAEPKGVIITQRMLCASQQAKA